MNLKKGFSFVVLMLLIISCSDNSSSPDSEGEAPTLPSLDAIQPDLSYFTENNPQKAKQTANNFNAAKTLATSLSFYASYGQFYGAFFQSAGQSNAEFQDGSWVWDYTYSYEGESVSVVLTSRETGNDFLWDMTWSYQGNQESFDDYTVIEGRTAKDGNSGSWTFNSLEPNSSNEIPVLITEWEKESDTEVSTSTKIYDSGQEVASFGYSQNGSAFNMTVNDLENQSESIISWNTDTMTGYYETDGEQKCWDSNFQDTEC